MKTAWFCLTWGIACLASAQTITITSAPYNASTGSADNAAAIQAAINAVGSGGTVVVPSGTFLSGPITLKSNMTFQLAAGAILRMTAFGTFPQNTSFVNGTSLTNITINGSGTMDGQGAAWWTDFNNGNPDNRPPAMIYITKSSNVTLTGITVKDSPKFHVQTLGSMNGVYIGGVSITAAWPSPNTDGIDLRGKNYLIENSYISDGDDVIQIGGSSDNCQGITIRNCTFGTGHGLSIGGYTQGGVSNLLVDSCTFNGTQYGIRWKTGRDRGGTITNLTYSNITMTGILLYPFFLTSFYPNPSSLPPTTDDTQAITSTTPFWSNITLKNITASTASSGAKSPGIMWAVAEAPVSNVLMDGVTVTGPSGVNFEFHHARGVTIMCNCRVDGAQPPTNVGAFDANITYPACGSSTNTFTFTPTRTFTPTATRTNTPTATRTNTPANTATNTPTATRTNTPTATRTNTPMNTPTGTSTNSATATRTNTPTATRTNTPLNTATGTSTNSATPTRTNTAANTPTTTRTNTPASTPTNTTANTFTNTATGTTTATRTNTALNTTTLTATNTSTSTAANTATRTNTSTATNTSMNTATLTPTNTATRTNSPSATNTATITSTNTPTLTRTNSATSTATTTPTSTYTVTSSFTATNSATRTFTSTATNTPTASMTPTASLTASNTATSTSANTLTHTPTSTFSATPTNTALNTSTNTPTKTNTLTATHSSTVTSTNSATMTGTTTPTHTYTITDTPSATNSSTKTATPTATNTPTSTAISTATKTPTNSFTFTASYTVTFTPSFTSTPTQVTIQVNAGSSSNSNQLPGASNVSVLNMTMNNPSPSNVTISSLTVSVSGTGSPNGSVTLTLLLNGNPVGIVAVSGNSATFNLTDNLPASGSVTYQVQASFSGSAPTGTYVFSLVGGTGTNGQTVNFSGLPANGATVNIATATGTPTKTATSTATTTPSFTPTYTNTPVPTVTWTATFTPTAISTATPIPTQNVPIIYPNPATGGMVNLLPPSYSGSSDVRVEIFTTAFRKVQDKTYLNVSSGQPVQVSLTDRFGSPLANEMYYLVVITKQGRSIAKLIILR